MNFITGFMGVVNSKGLGEFIAIMVLIITAFVITGFGVVYIVDKTGLK